MGTDKFEIIGVIWPDTNIEYIKLSIAYEYGTAAISFFSFLEEGQDFLLNLKWLVSGILHVESLDHPFNIFLMWQLQFLDFPVTNNLDAQNLLRDKDISYFFFILSPTLSSQIFIIVSLSTSLPKLH